MDERDTFNIEVDDFLDDFDDFDKDETKNAKNSDKEGLKNTESEKEFGNEFQKEEKKDGKTKCDVERVLGCEACVKCPKLQGCDECPAYIQIGYKKGFECEKCPRQSTCNELQIIALIETERDDKNIARIAKILADRFRVKHHVKTFITESDEEVGIFRWDGKRYVLAERDFENYLAAVHDKALLSQKKIRLSSILDESVKLLKLLSYYRLNNTEMLIGFKNGVLDWRQFLNGQDSYIRDYDPNTILFHYIPHEINTSWLDSLIKKCNEGVLNDETLEVSAKVLCPNTLEAFKTWVNKKWILLFEVIGFTLYPRYFPHKAIMLIGEGRNGKSTFLSLVRELLGQENTVSIGLQELAEERFVRAKLYRKLANIFADLPKQPLKRTGYFKILTGEDVLTADRKHRDPITFMNYAKLLFSTNELPEVNDFTLAFWRRWILIEFKNKIRDPDPDFLSKLIVEAKGILTVAITAFYRVLKRPDKKFSFEESEADYKEIWLRKTNSVYAFIQDLLEGKIEGYKAVKDPESRADKQTLYELYVDYCESMDFNPLAKRAFTIEMERMGFEQIRIHGKHYYYKGLKLEQDKKGEVSLNLDTYLSNFEGGVGNES